MDSIVRPFSGNNDDGDNDNGEDNNHDIVLLSKMIINYNIMIII